MPEPMRHLIHVMEARPFESMAALIAALMYLRLMNSGPRLR
ncbi:MAG TPA: hypothetical protein VF474_10855 [Phenylobacterium sp.]